MNIREVLLSWRLILQVNLASVLGDMRLVCFMTEEKSVWHFSNIYVSSMVYLLLNANLLVNIIMHLWGD